MTRSGQDDKPIPPVPPVRPLWVLFHPLSRMVDRLIADTSVYVKDNEKKITPSNPNPRVDIIKTLKAELESINHDMEPESFEEKGTDYNTRIKAAKNIEKYMQDAMDAVFKSKPEWVHKESKGSGRKPSALGFEEINLTSFFNRWNRPEVLKPEVSKLEVSKVEVSKAIKEVESYYTEEIEAKKSQGDSISGPSGGGPSQT